MVSLLQEFKRLAKHSAIYGVSNVLNTAIALILLPIYTHYLTPADYGILEVLTITVLFVSVFLQLGLGSAIFKIVLYDKSESEDVLVSTAFYFLTISSGIVFIILYLLAPSIADIILDSSQYANLVRLISLTAFLNVVSIIPLAKLRMHDESIKYSVISIGKFIVGVSLNIYFIAGLKKGVEGLVIAGAIQSFVFALILVMMLAKDLRLSFSGTALREMLSFGLPLVPMGIAASILSMADRYFLRYYTTLEETGLYALGYKFGSIITLIVSSFQIAWPAVLFSVAKRPDARKFYSKLLTYFVLGLAFVGLGVSVLSRELLLVMATEKFYDAFRIVPWIVFGNIFLGIYYATAIGTNLKKKTQYQAIAVIAAATLNLLLNFVLIPEYGMMGAAITTVISYAVMAAIGCGSSLRFYSIDYEWDRLLKIMVVGILLYCSSDWIHTGTLIGDVLLKSILILMFPFFLYLLHFFSKEELVKLRVILNSRLMNLGIVLGSSGRHR